MNPFVDDVFSGVLATEPTYPDLYANELEALVASLASANQAKRLARPATVTALLLSKQAGAGKSHFLARLASEKSESGVFVPLDMGDPDDMCWENWLRQVVTRTHEVRERGADHSVLTAAAAALFADGTSQLISEGRIPCESPAVASTWLRDHSNELFAHHHRDNESVRWFRSEFQNVLPLLADLYAKKLGLDRDELTETMEILFRYADLSSGETSPSEKRRKQGDYLYSEGALVPNGNEAEARRMLSLLGRLLASRKPLVLIFDDLDWFYREESTALRLARMLAELGRLVPGAAAVLSINEDHWKETFEKGLPEAVRDRLTSHVCLLEGVPREQWSAFLSARAQGEDANDVRLRVVLGEVKSKHPEDRLLGPRKLMRAAAAGWGAHASPVKVHPKPMVDPSAGNEEEIAVVKPTPVRAESPQETNGKGGQWAEAMHDLRDLIQSRSDVPSSATSAPGDPKPMHPATAKPDLTPEFRSFLSSLRARASDKKDYLPTKPSSNTERVRVRSELILHGRSSKDEESVSNEVAKPNPQLEETQAVRVKAEAVPSPPWVVKRLRDHRAEWAQNDRVVLCQDRLRRLVVRAGDLFPAIAQDTLNGDDPLSAKADLRWRFQQSEVHFAFEPFDDEGYWKSKVANVAARARESRDQKRTRCKLVVFEDATQENPFPTWDIEESAEADYQFCDVVLLTRSQLVNLYAIEQLLAEDRVAEDPGKVFAQVSGEIDFFWKMITRPVWTLVGQGRRALH